MKETLVLLPGLLCDGTVWKDQIKGLQEDWECLVVDYGNADSLALMAQVALDTAPEQFALAGHSMGARVAMEVIRLAAERVSRLALLDTGSAPLAQGEAGVREKQFRYRLLDKARAQGMQAMGEEWLKGMVHPDRLSDTVLWIEMIEMIKRKTPDIFAAQIKALLERPDANLLFPSITCPALVLTGREDNWSPVAEHQYIAAAIPEAHLHIIEDCGHMSPMERPQEVLASFRQWLAKT